MTMEMRKGITTHNISSFIEPRTGAGISPGERRR